MNHEASPLSNITPEERSNAPAPYAGLLACSTEVCAVSEPTRYEMSTEEELLLDRLFVAGDEWQQSLELGKLGAKVVLAEIEVKAKHHMGIHGETRALKRGTTLKHSEFGTTEQLLAAIRHEDRTHITQLINEVSGQTGLSADQILVTADAVLLEQIRTSLKNHTVAVAQRPCGAIIATLNLQSTTPYEHAFLKEYTSRTWLAEGAVEQAEFMRTIFHPSNINDLPHGLRLLAAADLKRGAAGSILLGLFQTAAPSTITSNNYPQEVGLYLAGDGHSQNVKNMLNAMSAMAVSLDAPRCPANPFGLCLSALQRVRPKNLPTALQDDIVQMRDKRGIETVSLLRKFAEQPDVQTSRWWRANEAIRFERYGIDRSVVKSGRTSKARGKIASDTATPRSFDQSVEPDSAPATETETGLSALRVSWPGQDEYCEAEVTKVLNQSVSVTVDTGIELIDRIVDSKEFNSYIDKYDPRGNELCSLIYRALTTILFEVNYRDDRSLKPMVGIKHIEDADGKRLRIWRLSGAHVIRGNKAPEGESTRIYFAMHGAGGVRTIKILGIRHKSEVDKNKNLKRIM